MDIKITFDEREPIETTAKELFDSLTEEHKKEIATAIIEEYFNDKYEWQRDDNKEKFSREIVSAFINQIIGELKENEQVKEIMDNAMQEVSAAFPNVIMNALVNIYTSNLQQQQSAIQHATRVLPQAEALINRLRY